jgi:undecaprenyl-diphosphatase
MVAVASALVLGLVQGLSEFLPISSSGHLLILHSLLPGVAAQHTLAFDVWLHAGTLLALLIYFRNDLVNLVRAAFTSPRSENGKLAWQVVVATLPVVVAVAFFGAGKIEDSVRSLLVVAAMLVVGSVMLLLGEKIGKQTSSTAGLSWWLVALLGVVQILALVPGLSRSGIVISVALLLGLRREAATRFAFLMAIPTLLGAVLFQWHDIFSSTGASSTALAAGFVAAFAAGYAAVAGLLAWVKTRRWRG